MRNFVLVLFGVVFFALPAMAQYEMSTCDEYVTTVTSSITALACRSEQVGVYCFTSDKQWVAESGEVYPTNAIYSGDIRVQFVMRPDRHVLFSIASNQRDALETVDGVRVDLKSSDSDGTVFDHLTCWGRLSELIDQ